MSDLIGQVLDMAATLGLRHSTRAMELIRKLRAKARRRYQELETCRAALDKTALERDALLLQVPRWRTIRSAPKDGTFILAYWDEATYPHEFVTRYGCVFWDGQRWNDEADLYGIDPTHWMPLPEPELDRAECDKAALVEGIRWYRMESPPFGQPVQIAKWEREHGNLAPPSAEPDQARILLPPGRWLVGERTVQLDAAEYVCKGSWALGTACGTCRKCVETKPEQTDKERG